MTKVMVLGLGDILYGDQGLGFYAVRDLCRQNWPQEVSFADKSVFNQDSLFLKGFEHLLVLGAMETGKKPGSLLHLGKQEFIQSKHYFQEPLLWKAIVLTELLGQLTDLSFMGLEPCEMAYDLNLSSALQGAYPYFLTAVREKLHDLLYNAHDERDKAIGNG